MSGAYMDGYRFDGVSWVGSVGAGAIGGEFEVSCIDLQSVWNMCESGSVVSRKELCGVDVT